MTDPAWLEYEKFVRDITESMLRADGVTDVTVQHNVQLPGASRTVQVDVYWQYRLGGVLHRVLINCKRLKRLVEVTDVETMIGVLTNFPGARGVLVSPEGFQTGAVATAMRVGIELFVIRPPRDEDYDGRIRSVEVEITLNRPELLRFHQVIDGAWVRANLSDEAQRALAINGGEVLADLVHVRDLDAGTVEGPNEIWNRVMAETGASTLDVVVERRVGYANAMIELPGRPALKLAALDLAWVVRRGRPHTMRIEHTADAVVRDILAGTERFVNRPGE